MCLYGSYSNVEIFSVKFKSLQIRYRILYSHDRRKLSVIWFTLYFKLQFACLVSQHVKGDVLGADSPIFILKYLLQTNYILLFKCSKSNFSSHREENLIILHVSDKEEIKVASLFLHFYTFKKITLK